MCNSCSMLMNLFFGNHIWKPLLQLVKSRFSSNFACASHFFVHTVTARLRCETALFHVLCKVKTRDNNFLLLFFKFANIWQTERDEISVLSLKQRNSLFKLHFCSCQVWLVRWIFSSRSKYGTFKKEYLRASDKANIWEWHVSTPYEFLILLNHARAYFISISVFLFLMHFFLFRIFSLWTLAISSKMVNFL